MKPHNVLLSAILAGTLASAWAEEPEEPPPQASLPTETWLELQRSGQAASAQAQPLSGPAMDRVHERYLKSFQYPIPPYFKNDQSLR